MKHPESYETIKQKLEQFCENPYDPELKNHKLCGQLKDLRAISVTYDCRIVFAMIENQSALLVAIVTHDEVY